MGTYSERRDRYIKKVNVSSKKAGIITIAVSFICLLIISLPFLSVIGNYILGIFGVVAYVLCIVGSLIGVALMSGRKYQLNVKYVTYFCVIMGCLISILHTAFSSEVLASMTSFSDYFNYILFCGKMESGISVGGGVFAVIIFPVRVILGTAGTYVVFSITLCIFGGLILDNIISERENRSKLIGRGITQDNYYMCMNTSSDSIGKNYAPYNNAPNVVPLKTEREDYDTYLPTSGLISREEEDYRKPYEKSIALEKPAYEEIQSEPVTEEGLASESVIKRSSAEIAKEVLYNNAKIPTSNGEHSLFEDELYTTKKYDKDKFSSLKDYITKPVLPDIFSPNPKLKKQKEKIEKTGGFVGPYSDIAQRTINPVREARAAESLRESAAESLFGSRHEQALNSQQPNDTASQSSYLNNETDNSLHSQKMDNELRSQEPDFKRRGLNIKDYEESDNTSELSSLNKRITDNLMRDRRESLNLRDSLLEEDINKKDITSARNFLDISSETIPDRTYNPGNGRISRNSENIRRDIQGGEPNDTLNINRDFGLNNNRDESVSRAGYANEDTRDEIINRREQFTERPQINERDRNSNNILKSSLENINRNINNSGNRVQPERFTSGYEDFAPDNFGREVRGVRGKDLTPRKSRESNNYSLKPVNPPLTPDNFNPFPSIDKKPVVEPMRMVGTDKRQKVYTNEKDYRYNAPKLDLLKVISDDPSQYGSDYAIKSQKIENTLKSFGIGVRVTNVVRGPTVTRYEISMPTGISVKKILRYDSDIAMNLESKNGIRIEAPILGKNAVGIEVPNDKRSIVGIREIFESKEFSSSTAVLPVAIGKNISGEVIVKSLAKMIHMLIAGSTGSGKSVFIHSLIMSLMYKASPEQLRFILIDPKRVEFSIYNGMPHMILPNVVNDADKAINALGWAIKEMERRYKVFTQNNVRDIEEYNHCDAVKNKEIERAPYIVIVVDELSELMMVGKREVEEKIRRISQLGRASGIHLVIATQRPSVEVVTGTIKTNLPTRIAFGLSSIVDSRTILDEMGAEKLLGQGDMLFAPQDSNVTTRLQAAFISMKEVEDVLNYIKQNNACDYNEDIEKEINTIKTTEEDEETEKLETEMRERENDVLLPQALKLAIESGSASTSMIQKRFYVGYARASRILDQMELAGYVSPASGSKARNVYITIDQYNQIFGNNDTDFN